MRRIKIYIILLTTLLCNSCATTNQVENKKQLIAAIEKHMYTFTAINVQPMSAPTFNLTSNYYTVNVKPDSVKIFLPYFGVSYNAPLDATKGGFDLTSTKFKYEEKKQKKGLYEIMITPQDASVFNTPQDIRYLILNIGESGYGTIILQSNNKQMISFYGTFAPTKLENKN